MSISKDVKCVVVGDVLIGKTTLLLKITTGEYPSFCYPTVFENYILDARLIRGTRVVLSFFDTSGCEDYDRLRPLSYPQTDVLLVCFSVSSYESFENVKYKWIPEITRHCPNAPWLLVGMKCDLRTDVHENRYLIARGMHVVEKTEALQLAQNLDVAYYECSAKEDIGLDDIVSSVAVAGLRSKKASLWPWKRNRKSTASLMPPQPQEPVSTKTPNIDVPMNTVQSEWLRMVNNKYLSDVQFHYKTNCYHGHKIVLCSASELFRQIFETGRELDKEEDGQSYCSSWSKERLNAINRNSIDNGAIGAFKNIYDKDDVTIVTVNDEQVTKVAFEKCLSFLYGGCGDIENDGDLDDTIAAAELLNLPKLIRVCDNVKNDKEVLNPYLTRVFAVHNSKMMEKLFFNKPLYSDITFVINGHKIPAHRCVLTTRCEVMSAMFSGQFAENTTTEVEIPEVDLDAFMAFLRYVYGDHCPLEEGEATTILVLANKYCMSRLKALCELYISEIVEQASDSSITTGELDVIDLLLNAQLHNADQLSVFLLRFVASKFQVFEKTEQFKKLTGDNLSYVMKHQSPTYNTSTGEEQKEKNGDEKESTLSTSNTTPTANNLSAAKESCLLM